MGVGDKMGSDYFYFCIFFKKMKNVEDIQKKKKSKINKWGWGEGEGEGRVGGERGVVPPHRSRNKTKQKF